MESPYQLQPTARNGYDGCRREVTVPYSKPCHTDQSTSPGAYLITRLFQPNSSHAFTPVSHHARVSGIEVERQETFVLFHTSDISGGFLCVLNRSSDILTDGWRRSKGSCSGFPVTTSSGNQRFFATCSTFPLQKERSRMASPTNSPCDWRVSPRTISHSCSESCFRSASVTKTLKTDRNAHVESQQASLSRRQPHYISVDLRAQAVDDVADG